MQLCVCVLRRALLGNLLVLLLRVLLLLLLMLVMLLRLILLLLLMLLSHIQLIPQSYNLLVISFSLYLQFIQGRCFG